MSVLSETYASRRTFFSVGFEHETIEDARNEHFAPRGNSSSCHPRRTRSARKIAKFVHSSARRPIGKRSAADAVPGRGRGGQGKKTPQRPL